MRKTTDPTERRSRRPGAERTIPGLAGAVAVLLLAFPAVAAEGDLVLELSYGRDDNPLRLAGGTHDAGYGRLRLDAGVRFRPERRVRFLARLGGRARVHEGAATDADSRSAEVTAAMALVPIRQSRRSLAILIGGRYGMRRSIFVDPETGRRFEFVEALPGGGTRSTPIPDRFDADTGEGFVDVRWQVNRRLRLSLATRLEERDYRNDYASVSGLDPLDHRALSIEPGVRLQLGSGTTVALTYSATERSYDGHRAADVSGTAVNGTLREYDYRGLRLLVRFEPTERLELQFGARAGDRRDLYAGYYDSAGHSEYAWMEWSVGQRYALQALISQWTLDYDRARVAGDASGELRGADLLTALGRVERRLPLGLSAFVELGAQQAENQDPVLAYDRNWAATGILFRR